MSKAEATYLGRLARLGCIVCRAYAEVVDETYDPPNEQLQLTVIHHVRAGQGGAQRAEDWLTMPLCVYDHVDKHGIHGDKARIKALKLTEMDCLAMTIELYHRTFGV